MFEPHLQGHATESVVESVGMVEVHEQHRGTAHHPIAALEQAGHLAQPTTEPVPLTSVHRHGGSHARDRIGQPRFRR